MRLWVARVLGLSGISAASAVAAHEGLGALGGGRPLVVALAGAAAAALGVCGILASAGARRASAARLLRGDVRAVPIDPVGRLPFAVLAAALLVCQAAAHTALLLLGAAAQGSPPAPFALHLSLALLGAIAMLAVERILGTATVALEHAIAVAIAALAGCEAPSPGRPVARLLAIPRLHAHSGRAPPVTA